MVSKLTQVLGNEEYSCIADAGIKILDESQINRKKWKCLCCDQPVYIKSIDENGNVETYLRLSIREVKKEDYVYIRQSGFIRVLAVGKEKSGHFIALERYRKLTKLTDRYFCLTRPTGRLFKIEN